MKIVAKFENPRRTGSLRERRGDSISVLQVTGLQQSALLQQLANVTQLKFMMIPWGEEGQIPVSHNPK